MWHICIYIIWFSFICNVFRRLIYLHRYVRTIFSIFHVPVNFLIRSVRFRNICNEMILWYTSEARIWFPTVKFITLIIRVAWIKGWFLFLLLLKEFLSWVWNYKVTSPWLIKICSLRISYRIVQIQIINLQVRYRPWFFINWVSSLLNSDWWIDIWLKYFPTC